MKAIFDAVMANLPLLLTFLCALGAFHLAAKALGAALEKARAFVKATKTPIDDMLFFPVFNQLEDFRRKLDTEGVTAEEIKAGVKLAEELAAKLRAASPKK